MSAAGRRRISLATKARWAKYNAAKTAGAGDRTAPQPTAGKTPKPVADLIHTLHTAATAPPRPIDAVLLMTAEELNKELQMAKEAQLRAGERVDLLQALYRAKSAEKTMAAG